MTVNRFTSQNINHL